jgi:hypothetical protein
MRNRLTFAGLLVIGLAISTSPIWARVGTVTLKELVETSDLIVVATEMKVEDGPADFKIEEEIIPSPKVAIARVLDVWKGKAGPEVRYLASPAFPCDISDAKVGERVVLFLTKPKELPFWAIADWGRGRMPIRVVEGKSYATIHTGDVQLLKGVLTIPGPEPKYDFIRSVELGRLRWRIIAMGRTDALIAASAGTFALAGLTWFLSSRVRRQIRGSAPDGAFDLLVSKLAWESRIKTSLRVIAKVEFVLAALIASAVLWCQS